MVDLAGVVEERVGDVLGPEGIAGQEDGRGVVARLAAEVDWHGWRSYSAGSEHHSTADLTFCFEITIVWPMRGIPALRAILAVTVTVGCLRARGRSPGRTVRDSATDAAPRWRWRRLVRRRRWRRRWQQLGRRHDDAAPGRPRGRRERQGRRRAARGHRRAHPGARRDDRDPDHDRPAADHDHRAARDHGRGAGDHRRGARDHGPGAGHDRGGPTAAAHDRPSSNPPPRRSSGDDDSGSPSLPRDGIVVLVGVLLMGLAVALPRHQGRASAASAGRCSASAPSTCSRSPGSSPASPAPPPRTPAPSPPRQATARCC